MFVESFTLNKNSWHAKLMKLIWGYKPRDFTHMCPYFWLTIFNVIVFIPYIVILGGLLKSISYPIVKLTNYLERQNDKRNAYKIEKILTDPDILTKINGYSVKKLKKLNLLLDKYRYDKSNEQLKMHYFDLNNAIYDLRRTKISENYKREAQSSERSKETYNNAKQSINKTLKFIKPLSTVLMYVVGLFIGYYLLRFLWWLIRLCTHIRISLDYFISFLVIGSITGLLIVIIYHFFFKLLPNLFDRIETKHFSWLVTFFTWIGMGILLIWNIVVQILHNNCPAIDWKEDNIVEFKKK